MFPRERKVSKATKGCRDLKEGLVDPEVEVLLVPRVLKAEQVLLALKVHPEVGVCKVSEVLWATRVKLVI